jgi:hypothetical protein
LFEQGFHPKPVSTLGKPCLVKREGFAARASIIAADASRHHRITPEEADSRRTSYRIP